MTSAIPATTSPESVPFLLVRASSRDVTDVTDEDEADESGAKSVPPHAPPAAVTTTETDLPSVIVDLRELEASAQVEAQRTSDIDCLLAATESLEVPTDVRRQPTLPTIDGLPRSRGTVRSIAFGLLAAVAIGGGALGAFLHLVHHAR